MKDRERLFQKIMDSGSGLGDLAREEMEVDMDGFIHFLTDYWHKIPEERLEDLVISIGNVGNKKALLSLGELIDESAEKRTTMILKIWAKHPEEEFLSFMDDLLKMPNSRIRANVVEAMADFPSGRAIDILRELLGDRDNRVRANAARALWKQGLSEGFEELKNMLKSPDIWTRASASFAISSIGDPQFFDSLLLAIKDESSSVREKAIIALGNINDDRAVPYLLEMAKDPEEHNFISQSALEEAARLGDHTIEGQILDICRKKGLALPTVFKRDDGGQS